MNKINKVLFMKPVNLILVIPRDKKQNMYRIARNADMTYSCASKNFKKLRVAGLIDLTKNGREMIVTLTEKGEELQLLLQRIISVLQ